MALVPVVSNLLLSVLCGQGQNSAQEGMCWGASLCFALPVHLSFSFLISYDHE